METPNPLLRLAAIVTALVLALAGCGGGESDTVSPEPEVDDTSGAEEEVVEVALRDFEFANLPASAAAGTRFTVANEADEELHELVAFRLRDEEERPVSELAGLSPVELVEVLGEPVTVLLAEPGGPMIPAVGDGTLADPGRYALMCFIPTGVEPQVYLEAAAETEEGPPQVEGAGPPHFVHGMHAELTVN